MMQTCALTDGFVRTGIIASTYGQVSVSATRCKGRTKDDSLAYCVGLRGCIFAITLTDGVPKVPKGCFEGFWHLWRLIIFGFLGYS